MKAYFARPIHLYKTKQDERDILLIKNLGFEIVNPDKEELQRRYKKEGMAVFTKAVKDCELLIFRAMPDGKISAGVFKELKQAQADDKPVLELPTILESKVLSVEDTRTYLRLIGNR